MEHYEDETEGPVSGLGMEEMLDEEEVESSEEDVSDVDEENEFTVKRDDNIILVGHVEKEACMLEAYGKIDFPYLHLCFEGRAVQFY